MADESYVADCTRRMVGHLRTNKLLSPGWSNSIGGRMRVEQSLLAESWNPHYAALGFDPDAEDPPFLKPRPPCRIPTGCFTVGP
jgi:type I restriction enzyme, R subunit